MEESVSEGVVTATEGGGHRCSPAIHYGILQSWNGGVADGPSSWRNGATVGIRPCPFVSVTWKDVSYNGCGYCTTGDCCVAFCGKMV